jgi:hypothetical protein
LQELTLETQTDQHRHEQTLMRKMATMMLRKKKDIQCYEDNQMMTTTLNCRSIVADAVDSVIRTIVVSCSFHSVACYFQKLPQIADDVGYP